MSDSTANTRLLKMLTASPEQLARIDRILAGEIEGPPPPPRLTGPLLLNMSRAARLLGVSRHTVWRLMRKGNLKPVEVRSRLVLLRRSDIERLGTEGVQP